MWYDDKELILVLNDGEKEMAYDLKKLQLVELQILKDVAEFCDKNDIVYFLDGGTLLGAIRHQGFIPWDDDIDIIMDVENYKKFCKLAPTGLPKWYFVQNMDTDKKTCISWTKVRKNGTTCMERKLTAYDVHYGVGIDIFVLIGAPKSTMGQTAWKIAKTIEDILLDKYYCQARGGAAPKCGSMLWKMPGCMRRWVIHILQKCIMVPCKGHEKLMNMWCDSFAKFAVPADTYNVETRKKMKFEDAEFWCPGGYDEILRAYYGEWWVIPPKEEQVTHGDLIVDFDNDYKMYYTGN